MMLTMILIDNLTGWNNKQQNLGQYLGRYYKQHNASGNMVAGTAGLIGAGYLVTQKEL